MTAALRVLSPGLMTTVQDLGRVGYQHLGVPVSGALDPVSLRAANLLVGNAPGTAALEIAYQGPALAVEADSVRIALAGGRAPVEIVSQDGDGGSERLPLLESARLSRGQVVRIGALAGSAVLYLAVEGGFDIAPVLGSRSTYTRAAIGGIEGRALKAGDAIPLEAAGGPRARGAPCCLRSIWRRPSASGSILGPQDDYFTEAGIAALLSATYTVTPASDRMGMRLAGPVIAHAKGYNIVSDGIAPGSIQVPGNGLPIVLLADRQTTGGYPKIATVISADMPALGRLVPGSKVAFEAVDIEAAEAAARQLAADLAAMPDRIVPARRGSVVDASKLMGENLVSGMVDAREGSG